MKIRWGIIGAGSIANVFCNSIRFSRTGKLEAVGSRDLARAKKLAGSFGCENSYGDYRDLLNHPEIDAVYISTIHPFHRDCVIQAVEAGKHVLVEKPMGMNVAEVAEMIDAAKRNNVFLMEAYMYRCHPQTKKMIQLLREGVVGDVRMIRSEFGFAAEVDFSSRLFDPELGGGAILDVGGYPMSMARLVAGAATNQPFAEPDIIAATGVVGSTGVDHTAVASLKFANGIVAQLTTSIVCELPSTTEIYGRLGVMRLDDPWLPSSPSRHAEQPLPLDMEFPDSEIEIELFSGEVQKHAVKCDRDLYSYEIDEVAACLSARQSPAMSWDDSLGNARALDEWRAAVFRHRT